MRIREVSKFHRAEEKPLLEIQYTGPLRRAVSVFLLIAVLSALSACGGREPAESSRGSFVRYESSSSAAQSRNPESEFVIDSEPEPESFSGASSRESGSRNPNLPSPPPSSSAVSTAPPPPTTVWVTIPEGHSIPQIAKLLESKNVCKAVDFLGAVENYDFSPFTYAPMLAGITSAPRRWHRLEGYLFPAKYEFYPNEPPYNVVGKMLRATYNNLWNKYSYTGKDGIKWSFDQILTLASIIEKESGKQQYRKDISAVLHNRLRKPMQLQCDATIDYIEKYVRMFLTEAQHLANRNANAYKDYNTYKCPALPAGPICSPGKNAMEAAANPSNTPEAAKYLFFYSDKNGVYHFSENGETHEDGLNSK